MDQLESLPPPSVRRQSAQQWVLLLLSSLALPPATADTIMLEVDGDGIPDQIATHSAGAEVELQITKSRGGELRIHGLPCNSVAELRVLAPADLDGDGAMDLVLSMPSFGAGRVWMFSGAAASEGVLSVESATVTLYSSMPGAIRFGEALGLIPGPQVEASPCLRVRSIFESRGGTFHPRVEVYRFDSRRLLLVVEGDGPLTNLWTDRGDGTRDGEVDASDILRSMARIGTPASFGGDLDGDGVVSEVDVTLVATEATVRSDEAVSQWRSVVHLMESRAGGLVSWGLPLQEVFPSAGPQASSTERQSGGTGVYYCARPMDTYSELPWWLAPVCHAYLQIGDWSLGYYGYTYPEDLNDGRSRRCWEASRCLSGSMILGGVTVNCADATIEQIRQCVHDTASAGGIDCDAGYDSVCNNCGDWVMNVIDACCLEGSYLPYLIY